MEERIESDAEGQPQDYIHHRRRRRDHSWWDRHITFMRGLLGTGVIGLIILYTDLVRDYTLSNKALADVIALANEHSRILTERENDVRAAAILKSQFDSHLVTSSREFALFERRIDAHDAQLRDLEKRMYERARQ